MKYHALFVIFEKVAKLERNIGGALRVNLSHKVALKHVCNAFFLFF